jgi:hypothetical protein
VYLTFHASFIRTGSKSELRSFTSLTSLNLHLIDDYKNVLNYPKVPAREDSLETALSLHAFLDSLPTGYSTTFNLNVALSPIPSTVLAKWFWSGEVPLELCQLALDHGANIEECFSYQCWVTNIDANLIEMRLRWLMEKLSVPALLRCKPPMTVAKAIADVGTINQTMDFVLEKVIDLSIQRAQSLGASYCVWQLFHDGGRSILHLLLPTKGQCNRVARAVLDNLSHGVYFLHERDSRNNTAFVGARSYRLLYEIINKYDLDNKTFAQIDPDVLSYVAGALACSIIVSVSLTPGAKCLQPWIRPQQRITKFCALLSSFAAPIGVASGFSRPL